MRKTALLLGLAGILLAAGCDKVSTYKGDFEKTSLDEVKNKNEQFVEVNGTISSFLYAKVVLLRPIEFLLENSDQYQKPLVCVTLNKAFGNLNYETLGDAALFLDAAYKKGERISVKGMYKNGRLNVRSVNAHGREFDFFK